MIKFACPQCGQKMNVSDDLAGKKGKCPKCSAVLEVPAGPEEELTFSDDNDLLGDHPDATSDVTSQQPAFSSAGGAKSGSNKMLLIVVAIAIVVSAVVLLAFLTGDETQPVRRPVARRAKPTGPMTPAQLARKRAKIEAELTGFTAKITAAKRKNDLGELVDLARARQKLVAQAPANIGGLVGQWKADQASVAQARKLVSKTRYKQAVALLLPRWARRVRVRPVNGQLGLTLVKAALASQALAGQWALPRKTLAKILIEIIRNDPTQIEAPLILAWMTPQEPREELLRLDMRTATHKSRNLPLLKIRSAAEASKKTLPKLLYDKLLAVADYSLGVGREAIKSEFDFYKTLLDSQATINLRDAAGGSYLLRDGMLWQKTSPKQGGWRWLRPRADGKWQPYRLRLVRYTAGTGKSTRKRGRRRGAEQVGDLGDKLKKLRPVVSLSAEDGRRLGVFASGSLGLGDIAEAKLPLYIMTADRLRRAWQRPGDAKYLLSPAEVRPGRDSRRRRDNRKISGNFAKPGRDLVFTAEEIKKIRWLGGGEPMTMSFGATVAPAQASQDQPAETGRRSRARELTHLGAARKRWAAKARAKRQAKAAQAPAPKQVDFVACSLAGQSFIGILEPLGPVEIPLLAGKSFAINWPSSAEASQGWPSLASLQPGRLLQVATPGGGRILLPLLGSDYASPPAIRDAAVMLMRRNMKAWAAGGPAGAPARRGRRKSAPAASARSLSKLLQAYGKASGPAAIVQAAVRNIPADKMLNTKKISALSAAQRAYIGQLRQQSAQTLSQLDREKRDLPGEINKTRQAIRDMRAKIPRLRGQAKADARKKLEELRRYYAELPRRKREIAIERKAAVKRYDELIRETQARMSRANAAEISARYAQGVQRYRSQLAAVHCGIDPRGRFVLFQEQADARASRRRAAKTKTKGLARDERDGELVFLDKTGQAIPGASYTSDELDNLLFEARYEFLFPSWARVPTPSLKPLQAKDKDKTRRKSSRRRSRRSHRRGGAKLGLAGELRERILLGGDTSKLEPQFDAAYPAFVAYCLKQAALSAKEKDYHTAAVLLHDAPLNFAPAVNIDVAKAVDREGVLSMQAAAGRLATAGLRKISLRSLQANVLAQAGRAAMAREVLQTAHAQWGLATLPLLRKFQFHCQSSGYKLAPDFDTKVNQLAQAVAGLKARIRQIKVPPKIVAKPSARPLAGLAEKSRPRRSVQSRPNKLRLIYGLVLGLDRRAKPAQARPAKPAGLAKPARKLASDSLLESLAIAWRPVYVHGGKILPMPLPARPRKGNPIYPWAAVYRSGARDYPALRRKLLRLASAQRSLAARQPSPNSPQALAATYNAIGSLCLAAATDDSVATPGARFAPQTLTSLANEMRSFVYPKLQLAGTAAGQARFMLHQIGWMISQLRQAKPAKEDQARRYYWFEYGKIAEGFFQADDKDPRKKPSRRKRKRRR